MLETSYAKPCGEGYMVISPGYDEYPTLRLPEFDRETGNQIVLNPIVYERVKDINDRARFALNGYIDRINTVISDLNTQQEKAEGAEKLVLKIVATQLPATLIKKLSTNASELSIFEDNVWEAVERYATE